MRALLEFVGIMAPDRTRREPVALPAWVRWLAPLTRLAVAIGLAAISTWVWLVLRSII